jgi:hypothetical protein
MDTELVEKIKEQDAKLQAIWESVEKTRKYFKWVFWITIALIVLPLIAFIFVIPSFISSYTTQFEGLL